MGHWARSCDAAVHPRARRDRPDRGRAAGPRTPADPHHGGCPCGRHRQHRPRPDPCTARVLPLLHPAARLHRLGVRDRHDRPNGDHLRERAAWPSGDGRGAQRGIGGDGDAGGPRRRHAAHRDRRRRESHDGRWLDSHRRRSTPRWPRCESLLVAIGTPGYGALVEGVTQPAASSSRRPTRTRVRTFLGATGVLTAHRRGASPGCWSAGATR